MTWIKYWLKYANYDEIKAEAERRGMFPTSIAPAAIFSEVNGGEVMGIMPSKYYIGSVECNTTVLLWDRDYLLTSLSEVKRFLEWNKVDKDHYVNDDYDCDNFAISLYADAIRWTNGLCFGFFITEGHAKNLFITNDRKVYEIEPQSDVVHELKSPVILYMM